MRRSIALRLTLASVLAMSAASALSLPNPWWAGMAVWMIGQPGPGLMLERCLAQLLGTASGAVVALALLLPWPGYPAASLVGLAVWISACCGMANLMRHQRAYGAALCGLTSAVIVVLTVGTPGDPLAFTLARATDNLLGIAAALLVARLLAPARASFAHPARVPSLAAEMLVLIAGTLERPQGALPAEESAFLLSLAALEASAEDAAAGSPLQRRRLKGIHAAFASLLDLLAIVRAIRSRNAVASPGSHAAHLALRDALQAASGRLTEDGAVDMQPVVTAAEALERADPVLSPPLREMRALLATVSEGLSWARDAELRAAPRWSLPHPEIAGLRLAMLRGGLAVLATAAAWLLIGWEPLRYLVLGASIFTVLFSSVDQPVPVIRQVLLGGLVAAAAATLWRLGVVPWLSDGWLSLALAVPLIYGASLIQSDRRTSFFGLAFNMLFAVLARPVDMSPSDPVSVIAIEAMLLCGVALSYVSFRWLLPMHPGQRRDNLRRAVQREIAAIARLGGEALADRHLARLRYLVFRLAVLAQGQVAHAEDALAALSLGHVAFHLGQARNVASASSGMRGQVESLLLLITPPMQDTSETAARLLECAAALGSMPNAEDGAVMQLRWLIDRAVQDLGGHGPFFAPVRSRR